MTAMSTLPALLDAFDNRPQALKLRERTYHGLGDTVVDVRCRSGRAVGELATRGVRAIGVDLDPAMIEIATERWPKSEFHVADATALPLDDGSVTGYRADKVLHGLDEPERAVSEARRVLTKNGRAVLIGQDWDTSVIDSELPELTRTPAQTAFPARGSPADTGTSYWTTGSSTSPSRSTPSCGQTLRSCRCSPTSQEKALGSTTKPPEHAMIDSSWPSRSFSPPGLAPIEYLAP